MKYIFFILTFIVSFNFKAQSPVISTVVYANNDDIELTEASYLKDVENKFSPFLGTWKWQDGNNELTITFTKLEMVYNNGLDYYCDYLIGKYKYVENGIVIFNSLNYNGINANNFFTSKGFPFVINGSGYAGDNYQDLSFYDNIKEKYCHASIEILQVLELPKGTITSDQMQWKLWDKEHITVNGEPNLQQGFSIPNEVVLTKK